MSLLTLIAPACDALGLDPLAAGLQLLDARQCTAPPPAPPTQPPGDGAWCEVQGIGPYTPPVLPYPLLPSRPALICRLANAALAAQVQALLLMRFPPDHPLRLVEAVAAHAHAAPAVAAQHALALSNLAEADMFSETTCLFVPALAPLDDLHGPDGLAAVIARLLGPSGCPWDREQTHHSLRKELLEETYEALEAIDQGDMAALSEELGDVLLSVLVHSEMARQAGSFDSSSVYHGIASKLIRRHPHIFGTTTVTGTGEVLKNWEAIKGAERAAKGQAPRGTLDGIPAGLPALMQAQELTRKAARAGFDSPVIEDGWAKLHEELAELREVAQAADPTPERLAEEFGDLLLAAAKLGWKLQIDAESALRTAGAKFRRRFIAVEAAAAAQGRSLHAMTLAERRALWNEAKRGNDANPTA